MRVGWSIASLVAFRTYKASNGPLRNTLTWASRMRLKTAADTAGRLLDRLSAQCVAMCGVCAGRRGKVQPGDVIVGDLLYTYDAGSVQVEYDPDGTKHERFQADPDPVPLNETWRHRAQAFKPPVNSAWILARPATLAAQGDWILARLHGGEDPMTHRESQERCPAWKEALKRLEDLGYVSVSEHAKLSLSSDGRAYISRVLLDHRGSLPESPPWHIHLAPIATGSSVMRDPTLFERLSDQMRKVLGVEMDADFHHLLLRRVKHFYKWGISRRYVMQSLFAEVPPIGRPKRGKQQLRIDEARKLVSVAKGCRSARREGRSQR